MKPIGLTMGDPAGVGPETIIKSHLDPDLDLPFVVYGDPNVLTATNAALGADVVIEIIDQPKQWAPGALMVIAVTTLDPPRSGYATATGGQASADYIERASSDALDGHLAAVVTAPINKEALRAAGVPFPGHTEMLQHLTSTPAVAMMLATPHLRVVLATIHLSLRDAIDQIDQQRVEDTIVWADQGARLLGVTLPRIAVAGLNPHAGENGLFGSEDDQIIRPAVDAAKQQGLDVSGPHPPDTVFMRARDGEFDIVRGPVSRPRTHPGQIPRHPRWREHHRRPPVSSSQRRSRNRIRHRRNWRRRPRQPRYLSQARTKSSYQCLSSSSCSPRMTKPFLTPSIATARSPALTSSTSGSKTSGFPSTR